MDGGLVPQSEAEADRRSGTTQGCEPGTRVNGHVTEVAVWERRTRKSDAYLRSS